MTRDEVLAHVLTRTQSYLRNNETRLVIDLALRGVPPDQILGAYRYALDHHAEALIETLRLAEAAIDELIANTKEPDQ